LFNEISFRDGFGIVINCGFKLQEIKTIFVKIMKDDQSSISKDDSNHVQNSNYNKNNDVSNQDKGLDDDQSPIVLKVENVYKIFDSPAGRFIALKKLNFSVRKGEFVSIVGPSGSGKSTLLNILGALDRPTSGRVLIDGIDIFSLDDNKIAEMRNKLIGYIFQSFNLINRSSVLKNVEIPSIFLGMNSKQRHQRAMKLLEVLGLENKSQYKPMNLSGGQQQRVAIARCLMNNPAIILADEPTGNLDTKTGGEVFDLLKKLTKELRRTIIFVTHNPQLASETDRVIFIKDGGIEKEERNEVI
jgi:putative ABC transport system ATP-binding protein